MIEPTLSDVLTKINWWQKWEIKPGVFTNGPHDVKHLIDELEWPASFEAKGFWILATGTARSLSNAKDEVLTRS